VNALSYLALTLNGSRIVALVNLSTVALVNLAMVVVSAGCFSAWAILLTRKGEERELIPAMPPEDIARIERVNQELLGLMRNFPG
jgi:hypothetical protein